MRGRFVLEPMLLVLMSGLVLGMAIGAASRWAEFCTLGAIADAVIVGHQRRLRAWGLAIAVAVVGTQALHLGGLVELGQSLYLDSGFGWLGALIGGVLFGFGMALVGTCGYGTLIRLGGGDIRALIDLATLGIFAYLTLSGPLAYVRVSLNAWTDISIIGLSNPGFPELLSLVSGWSDSSTRALITLLLVLSLLWFCFRDRIFWTCHRDIAAAVIIGLAVCLAWLVTGYLGYDEFDPKSLISLTFVRPLGDSILYLMLASGMSLTFGIASVIGVLLGAHFVARSRNELRLEGFDGEREMLRHLTGSALMGIGGVLALGCTIGQGISGLSTLALSAPLALASIFGGAVLGLRYLEEGSLVAAFKVLARRSS